MSRDTPYKVYEKVIPKAVCEQILLESNDLDLKDSGVVVTADSETQVDNKVRKTEVGFWPDDCWINGLITHYIAMANRDIWQFDVLMSQGVQFGRYANSGFYNWHKDEFDLPFSDDYPRAEWRGLNRKLSVSVNIVDGDDYEGGDLRFKNAWGSEIDVPQARQQGSVIVFPSYVLHCVTPVTKGVRKSLVSWILGPQLR